MPFMRRGKQRDLLNAVLCAYAVCSEFTMLLMLVAFYRWNSPSKDVKRRRKKLVRSISLGKYNIQSGHQQQLLLLKQMGTWGFEGETLLPSTSFSPRTIPCTNLWKSHWLSCLVGRNSLKLTFHMHIINLSLRQKAESIPQYQYNAPLKTSLKTFCAAVPA